MVRNWKTTLAGCIAAIAFAVQELLVSGRITTEGVIMAAAIAALGVLAKDFDVTGGGQGGG